MHGREYARTVRRGRRMVAVLLALTTVALVAVVGLTRLDIARTSGPRPVASTETVAAALAPQFALRPVAVRRAPAVGYTVRAGDRGTTATAAFDLVTG